MGYILGLDIGITSVGWSILDINEACEPYKINNLGVRIFERAEHPKTGAPLALPRREARGARRRNRRKKHRKERIKQLISKYGLLTQLEIEGLYNGQVLSDIYEVRYRALKEKLEVEEWVRLLIHLAQRRGFRSNRKSVQKEDDGKLLKAIQENKAILVEKGYCTPGEMLYKDARFNRHKRNTIDDYICTLSRDMLVDEIHTLFERQRAFGNIHAKVAFEEEYVDIYTSQRSFDEGPGGKSPYANPLEKMIGQCTFEKEEKRASKASYTFQYFRLLTSINNLRVKRTQGNTCVTSEERQAIIVAAFTKEKITYKDLRKILNLQTEDKFKDIYSGKKNIAEVEAKTVFCKLEGYHTLRKALDHIDKNYIKQIEPYILDEIAYALTLYKTDSRIKSHLKDKGIADDIIEQVSNISFSQYGHLSIKALRKIIPYLEQGMTYDKACEACGYNFNQIKLPDTRKEFIDQITNPVVRRGVAQTLKVVDAIIRCYGAPAKIHIELARDMSRNFTERKKIEKLQDNNRTQNEKLKQEIADTYGVNATGNMLVKYKLWKEQQGHCMYSNEYIQPDRLFADDSLTEIDHIIPYSKSFDDTYNNKVLVLASENRQKSNQTPFEYLSTVDLEKWYAFEEWTRLYIRNDIKKQNLLKKHIDEDDEATFKTRNLTDTRYITKLVSGYLKQKIAYDTHYHIGQRVVDVNGAITAYCRKRWGLSKIREDGDLHHALDAVVIACITPNMIQKVTKYHQVREDELLKNTPFPQPWEQFRDELVARLEENPEIMLKNLNLETYQGMQVTPVFVSRMPRRKSTGKVHEDTLKGSGLKNEGYTISRVPIQKLNLKDGEIENYYNKEANIALYTALKERLLAYGGNAKKAFETPFYKPQKSNQALIEVKKVKIQQRENLLVEVNQGKSVAANESMIRIDIFTKDNKYYIVPIYMKDVVAKKLPNKAIVANKRYEEWIEMDESYEFKFTLYPNDLIYFKHKKGAKFKANNKESLDLKEGFAYYVKTHSGNGGITIRTHDNKYLAEGMGVKTLITLEKYVVDVLGNKTKINKETRLDYTNKKR